MLGSVFIYLYLLIMHEMIKPTGIRTTKTAITITMAVPPPDEDEVEGTPV